MLERTLARVGRAARKPPRELLRRVREEATRELDSYRDPRRGRRFSSADLLQATDAPSIDELWARTQALPWLGPGALDARALDSLCPDASTRVLAGAERVLARRVDLLGTGPLTLGHPVDWHRDYKTETTWPLRSARRIDYTNLERPSDVKIPWEISRLQWALPAAQAYVLTDNEDYAAAVRDLLHDWMQHNPYAVGVNWSIAMEAALRLLTWTWLFHAFAGSAAWQESDFRARFLSYVFLHGRFVERNLERSGVNGNHFTADCAGLVFAGLFFGDGEAPRRWERLGWRLLEEELPRQVLPDGVDFEASTAYHRLVTELFLLPALLRERRGLPLDDAYRHRVTAAARFASSYTRPDGTFPHWGDEDDARALPLGGQGLDDHRYLCGLVGAAWHDVETIDAFSGPRDEIVWTLGVDFAERLPNRLTPASERRSIGFADGGVFLLRSDVDHVFIDCGPVGLAGRGGHGHNDCLAFDAMLAGVHVVADPGSYVYTASPELRNRFRSTAVHNTPTVDGAEQNRFSPSELWTLREDATPHVLQWGPERNFFRGAHGGYRRLPSPVTPVRSLALDPDLHRLAVHDCFEGEGAHDVSIAYTFPPTLGVTGLDEGALQLTDGEHHFVLLWEGAWSVEQSSSWFSPSYGVRLETQAVTFTHSGPLRPLLVVFSPAPASADALAWARTAIEPG